MHNQYIGAYATLIQTDYLCISKLGYPHITLFFCFALKPFPWLGNLEQNY